MCSVQHVNFSCNLEKRCLTMAAVWDLVPGEEFRKSWRQLSGIKNCRVAENEQQKLLSGSSANSCLCQCSDKTVTLVSRGQYFSHILRIFLPGKNSGNNCPGSKISEWPTTSSKNFLSDTVANRCYANAQIKLKPFYSGVYILPVDETFPVLKKSFSNGGYIYPWERWDVIIIC